MTSAFVAVVVLSISVAGLAATAVALAIRNGGLTAEKERAVLRFETAQGAADRALEELQNDRRAHARVLLGRDEQLRSLYAWLRETNNDQALGGAVAADIERLLRGEDGTGEADPDRVAAMPDGRTSDGS